MFRVLYIILLLIAIPGSLAAAEQQECARVEHHLDITNGLAHNGVSSLLRDSRGYLWIGTFDGLNRYDDFKLTTYKNSVGSQLFQSNRVRSLAEDGAGRLWIGTDLGVTIFDYQHQTFRQLYVDSDNISAKVSHIFVDDDSRWVACFCRDQSILLYDISGELLRYSTIPQNCMVDGVISIGDGQFLLATTRGVIYYDADDGKLEYLSKGGARQAVNSIIRCGEQEYIAAMAHGIRRLRIEVDGTSRSAQIVERGQVEYPDLEVNSMAIDDEHSLWLGCNKMGLTIIRGYLDDKPRERVALFDSGRLGQMLFEGSRCYISTYDRGVSIVNTELSKFRCFTDEGINTPQVIPYDQQLILVNYIGGLQAYDKLGGGRVALPFEIDPLLERQAKVLFRDREQRLWIAANYNKMGTQLFRLEDGCFVALDSEEFTNIKHSKSLGGAPVEAICDGEGNFWVAYSNNLYRLRIDAEAGLELVESIWSHGVMQGEKEFSRTRSLYYDKSCNTLWVGTSRRGMFRIDLNSSEDDSLSGMSIEHYLHDERDPSSISANFVSAIVRASDGTLWVGTEQGGLCRAIEGEGRLRFETLSEPDGLSNNVVKSICEDSRSNLWIGTNIGLNLYDVEQDRFVVYRRSRGLQHEDFWYSSFAYAQGDMVFSSVGGVVCFDPASLYDQDQSVSLYFDDLKIYGNSVLPGQSVDGEVILGRRLESGDHILLKHSQNVFSIDVDILNAHAATSNSVSYQLSPTGREWTDLAANNRTISFSGVEPGDYELRVRALDGEGELVDNLVLKITLTPPLYRSTYAYILYAVLLLILCFVILRSMLSFQALSHNLQMQILEQSLNEDKLRYFSNLSHELKTPLSLILATLAIMRERLLGDEALMARLDLMKRQSKRLYELIDIIHGIEANDLEGLKCAPTIFSFDRMVDDISKDFEFISEYDNKRFVVQRADQPLVVEADRAMVEKVINNLISNALKHTVSGDEIKLIYHKQGEDQLVLIVSDSGCGIAPEDMPYIFDRFYQARRSGANNIGGTGIGLSLSKRLVEMHRGEIGVESDLGRGTKFTVTLPIAVDAYLGEDSLVEPPVGGAIIDVDDNIVIQNSYSSSLVYLVEDNYDLRKLLCEIIGKHFQVSSYPTAMDMLAALDQEWPDIVVSDVMMPEIDGYELCRRLKEDLKTSHIPVILLTAASTVDAKIIGLKVGADAYIPKPFYPKHLITRIETLLHSRHMLCERFQVGIPLAYGKEGSTSAKDNEFMQRLYELINENIGNENINLDELALALGQNRSMFFKRVKSITASSPYELIKEYRLVRAAELLQKGEHNVGEVCTMTGFKDRSHFSRLFKDKYNVSPSRYGAKEG
ncbi:MAG: two-component regulator propeller domain-containing protein [Rikenellaceae bacterium]